MATEKLIDFDQVVIGYELSFLTADNGYSGSGSYVARTGVVTSKTEKTVTVKIAGCGKARLLRRDWNCRTVRHVIRDKVPYDADHVLYVNYGHTVWALWTPDPDQAKDPQAIADNITNRAYANVEVIAEMSRLYRSEGALVSGWQICADGNAFMAGTRKTDAMKQLREAVADYFKR